MIELRQQIQRALDASSRTGNICVFPTILVDWPLRSQRGITSADVAMAYLSESGFKCDRSRMNLDGYPGLFRELNTPPPWIEVSMEDTEGHLTAARADELRPLYLHAIEGDTNDLAHRYREYRADKRTDLEAVFDRAVPFLAKEEALMVDEFKEKIKLAQCLGANDFESLYEAVFEYDEFTVASGAPDLFVWDTNAGIWFFAEVKGQHDHVRRSQAGWINANWDRIKGRVVLVVGTPSA